MRKLIGTIFIMGFGAAIVVLVMNRRSVDIVVGSKHFTEQKILAEMIAQLVEQETELTVGRRLGLQGTKIAFAAIRQGNLDIYPEYTGTALVNILEQQYDPNQGRQEILDYVRQQFKEKWDLQFLEPLGFANTYTFAMREKQAERLGIKKVSDLEKYAGRLRPGFDHEFTMRPEYRRFEHVYGFGFEKDVMKLDPDLTYKALRNGSVDIIDAFSTDGRIAAYNIRVLKDDKNLFPPYDACLVIRKDALEKYPAVKRLLEKLDGRISERDMRQMNYAVTENLEAPSSVAREFLVDIRLIEPKDLPQDMAANGTTEGSE
jgi:glycine betaine/choline ABC-type transport system substrate-binding protein